MLRPTRSFAALVNEARTWFEEHPDDLMRMRPSVSNAAFNGEAEDDPEKFFRRSPWDVSPADLWRWKACCHALRQLRR